LGRGDFARLSTASGLLTMRDTTEANRLDARFPDLLAWIRTIEPPKYPYPIDQNLAATGKKIFEKRCAGCHGTYGDSVSYPNLLVSLEKIGTDSLLSSAYQFFPEYHTWYNSSWYGQGPHKGQLLPNDGYVAPPLDGIWATAPYLHNASVPTLEDLLDSPRRPVFWKRIFENTEANYDKEKVGWKYSVETAKTDVDTYDTTLPGYGNMGHKFGDRLSAEERKAVVEYLKTL
jgi:mono/diheme cytochrome c family protein